MTAERDEHPRIRRAQPGYTWEGVARMPYKEEGQAQFRAISRQLLFSDPELDCELRYFEIEPDGYSTLERHQHAHAVMILRGTGHCLIGDRVRRLQPHDLIHIPALTWHQFRATRGEALGFLCMVNAERDRPQLPDDRELEVLAGDPDLAAFLRGTPVE